MCIALRQWSPTFPALGTSARGSSCSSRVAGRRLLCASSAHALAHRLRKWSFTRHLCGSVPNRGWGALPYTIAFTYIFIILLHWHFVLESLGDEKCTVSHQLCENVWTSTTETVPPRSHQEDCGQSNSAGTKAMLPLSLHFLLNRKIIFRTLIT